MAVSVHSEAQCKCPIFITQGTVRNVRKHKICTALFTHVFKNSTTLFTHVFEGENKGEIEET